MRGSTPESEAQSRPAKAPLLMLSPVMPDETGSGIVQRAGLHLQALAALGPVHLLVLPVLDTPAEPSLWARRHAARIGRLDLHGHLDPHFGLIARILDPRERHAALLAYPKPFLTRFCTSSSAEAVLSCCSDAVYAALHVFRLYLAPFAAAMRRKQPGCISVLDLDDDESRTAERMGRLYQAYGDERQAAFEQKEALKYAALAQRELPGFDRVLVCSQVDAEGLGALMPSTKITVVPNAAPMVRRAPPRERAADAPIRLLFVGAMGYFPNQDAARFLCRDVVPCLLGMTDRPVRIDIVGQGSVERLADLGHDPTVHLHGRLPDLTACYAEADIAVVPIRAGGGTRIKILEAFGHGTPVVATSLGAEGIEGVDREHLLIADDATHFARACLELVQTPALREALARNGRSLVETRYGRDAVTARIVRMYGECGITASADAQSCVTLEETDAAE